VITVRAEYHARFREITTVAEETLQLEQPLVAELARLLTQKYGPRMEALLIDPDTKDLNNKGTLFLDSKGRRISIDDTLEDGEVISFMVGIAGGSGVQKSGR
jgi:molybdopterin converting factor small subunit